MKNIEKDRYNGVILKQYMGIRPLLENFIRDNSFEHVIEIGTCPGGLAMFISDLSVKYNFYFTTFDIRKPSEKVIDYLKGNDCDYLNQNVLDNDLLKRSVKHEDKTLILNDGVKVLFFKEYVNLLKPGDVMMTHDYITEWNTDDLGKIPAGIEVVDNEFIPYLWFTVKRKETV